MTVTTDEEMAAGAEQSMPARAAGRVDARVAGVAVAGLGAAMQVAGLAVDAVLHAADPSLSAREGVFSLSNVGHALLLAGICLVVFGAALALAGPSLYREGAGRRRRVAQVGAPIALAAALVAATALGATSSLADGDDHDAAAMGDHHTGEDAVPETDGGATDASAETAAAGGIAAALTDGADHGHGDGEVVPDQPLDRATRDALAAQLVKAREVAMAHPTVAVALLDGYQQVTPYVPLIGAHFMRFAVVDGKFDIERPEMLLYDGTSPDSRIVGLSYYVRSKTEPAGFAGPNDHWHRHVGLCVSTTTFQVVGNEQTSAEECRRRGGVKADGTDGWMVHAWVVPGWESPIGVFSADHPGLT